MLGAPEVISLNAIFIRSMRAKKVLDIGVFTGASSLAAALALPEDGKVLACDINDTWTKMAQEYWVEAGVQHKIELVLAPATETLEKTLDNGEKGSFDFAFIDADKPNYEKYFELCLELLRTGGMMAFDNTLWSGDVLDESKTDLNTSALRELNKKLSSDPRVTAVLLNVGDGLTLVTKL
ncbi:probable caffeoyl-CoA O-methyltransferase 1 isoform X2 [Eurytemora carolleeae]|nr:probable caffeoyl-CoA O-methyltransferase 1 isoform X2 [Eurytemora carolleeae]|eukprot:XP_023342535.1 probable caffeoyl-CoA O-methyltransferase 1 isoform X2 [Eurytemora affinis]